MAESLTLAPSPVRAHAPRREGLTPSPDPTRPIEASTLQTSTPWRGRFRAVFLGRPEDPRWARPLLWALMLGAAALYLVDLTSSGTANSFYAAAVKSGTTSLKAWLFGSLDSANAITVDKPPASLWLMVLSARIFGFSSFSMLLPQALMGIGSVGLLYAAVRRWAGPAAGLLAGTALALTPVAALMFRFNNPDALLVFLMTLAAYCIVRAIGSAGGTAEAAGSAEATVRSAALRWMVAAGAAIGFAFLTKMAQGLLVLPALGAVYLVVAPIRLRTRIVHLLAATVAMVVSAGWFIALVELWPAAARPYIGGSTNNSLWELALGYNGLSRLLGGSGNGAAGGGMGGDNTSFGGAAGLLRLFGSAFGTQISWLLPAALLALVVGLVARGRAPRTDRLRAGLLLWGGWLVLTALVFSFMSGTIHPYYSVALAPAIAALIGITGSLLWSKRDEHLARAALATMIGGTAVWGFVLMVQNASGWQTWLAWTMLIVGTLSAVLLAISAGRLKKLAVAAALLGTLAAFAGTASFTVATVASGHTGSIPTAGPASVAMDRAGGTGGGPGGMPSGQTTDGPSTGTSAGTSTGSRGGGMGEASPNSDLVSLLDATSTRWSAAVIGDQTAAGYILATDTAVMAIGGWSGSDNAPTLAEFQQYVAAGDISYFIAGGTMGGGPGGGSSDSVGTAITTWVEAHYTATTVGGVTVYDLTG